MTDQDIPQIYLITPPVIDLEPFTDQFSAVLDKVEISCVRMGLASGDEAEVIRVADALRLISHERDVPLVINDHVQMVERLGLDGVHLTDSRGIRTLRKDLGEDAIIGAFGGVSRHDGLTAGEAGADYVAFGPVTADGLGDGQVADAALFAWWTEMIEVPVVAEGGLTPQLIESMAPVTDFFGIGPEIWGTDDPAKALQVLTQPLR